MPDEDPDARFADSYPDERTGPDPEEIATREQEAQFNAPATQAVLPPAGVAPATLPPTGAAPVAAGPQPTGWGVTWNAQGQPFYAVSYPPSPEQVAAQAQAASAQAHARQVAAMATLYRHAKAADAAKAIEQAVRLQGIWQYEADLRSGLKPGEALAKNGVTMFFNHPATKPLMDTLNPQPATMAPPPTYIPGQPGGRPGGFTYGVRGEHFVQERLPTGRPDWTPGEELRTASGINLVRVGPNQWRVFTPSGELKDLTTTQLLNYGNNFKNVGTPKSRETARQIQDFVAGKVQQQLTGAPAAPVAAPAGAAPAPVTAPAPAPAAPQAAPVTAPAGAQWDRWLPANLRSASPATAAPAAIPTFDSAAAARAAGHKAGDKVRIKGVGLVQLN